VGVRWSAKIRDNESAEALRQCRDLTRHFVFQLCTTSDKRCETSDVCAAGVVGYESRAVLAGLHTQINGGAKIGAPHLPKLHSEHSGRAGSY